MKIAIISGSVFGGAEEVAHHAKERLQAAGHDVWYRPTTDVESIQQEAPEALLAVVSTTGTGDLPGNFEALYHSLRDQLPAWLRGLPGGIIALGDSGYCDSYCGAGEQVDELFVELGIEQVQPMLRLDASETVTQDTDSEPWVDAFHAALAQR